MTYPGAGCAPKTVHLRCGQSSVHRPLMPVASERVSVRASPLATSAFYRLRQGLHATMFIQIVAHISITHQESRRRVSVCFREHTTPKAAPLRFRDLAHGRFQRARTGWLRALLRAHLSPLGERMCTGENSGKWKRHTPKTLRGSLCVPEIISLHHLFLSPAQGRSSPINRGEETVLTAALSEADL